MREIAVCGCPERQTVFSPNSAVEHIFRVSGAHGKVQNSPKGDEPAGSDKGASGSTRGEAPLSSAKG